LQEDYRIGLNVFLSPPASFSSMLHDFDSCFGSFRSLFVGFDDRIAGFNKTISV
jgi:hypothetical protein